MAARVLRRVVMETNTGQWGRRLWGGAVARLLIVGPCRGGPLASVARSWLGRFPARLAARQRLPNGAHHIG